MDFLGILFGFGDFLSVNVNNSREFWHFLESVFSRFRSVITNFAGKCLVLVRNQDMKAVDFLDRF